MHVCYLRQGACVHFVICDSNAYHMTDKMTFLLNIYAIEILRRFGAVSRRGVCLIWFRGQHIPPSMPYREARSVAESSEGPTASKSDRKGRNPGMTRLVRRSSATSGGTAYFSPLVFKHSVRACVRKFSASPIPTILDIFSWNT